MRWAASYGFCIKANFVRFPVVQNLKKNQLRFGKVTDSYKVGSFLRHNVYSLTASLTISDTHCYFSECCCLVVLVVHCGEAAAFL